MPNAAEKVKDDETKMCPLDFVINMLLISAKTSFYKVVRDQIGEGLEWRLLRTYSIHSLSISVIPQLPFLPHILSSRKNRRLILSHMGHSLS